MLARQAWMREPHLRQSEISVVTPYEPLVIDELAMLKVGGAALGEHADRGWPVVVAPGPLAA